MGPAGSQAKPILILTKQSRGRPLLSLTQHPSSAGSTLCALSALSHFIMSSLNRKQTQSHSFPVLLWHCTGRSSEVFQRRHRLSFQIWTKISHFHGFNMMKLYKLHYGWSNLSPYKKTNTTKVWLLHQPGWNQEVGLRLSLMLRSHGIRQMVDGKPNVI